VRCAALRSDAQVDQIDWDETRTAPAKLTIN
jgi:hypothetical protein